MTSGGSLPGPPELCPGGGKRGQEVLVSGPGEAWLLRPGPWHTVGI